LGIFYCLVTWNWGNYFRSLEALKPYQGGPSVFAHSSDLLVALIGKAHRQGPIETGAMLTGTLIAIPWIKYFINANPWIYPLEERFVNQLSTSCQDMPIDTMVETGRHLISDVTPQDPETRENLDKWDFVPHYAYPPLWRRWTLGLQTISTGKGFGLAFNIVHVTHAVCAHGGSTEQFVLSNGALRPIYRVMLWYSNPYHFFTGWAEGGTATGESSQQDKARCWEHPLWIISTHAPRHCRRNAWCTVTLIDEVFDKWFPFFVKEVRRLAVGPAEAEELFEGVVSKEGISRPAGQKEVPFVPLYPEED